jgi:hypothetical protein
MNASEERSRISLKEIYLIRTGLPGREFTGKLVVTK